MAGSGLGVDGLGLFGLGTEESPAFIGVTAQFMAVTAQVSAISALPATFFLSAFLTTPAQLGTYALPSRIVSGTLLDPPGFDTYGELP